MGDIHFASPFPDFTRHHFDPTSVTLATGDYRYPIEAEDADIDAAMGAFARDLRRWFRDLQPGRYRAFFDLEFSYDDGPSGVRRIGGDAVNPVYAPMRPGHENEIRDLLLDLLDVSGGRPDRVDSVRMFVIASQDEGGGGITDDGVILGAAKTQKRSKSSQAGPSSRAGSSSQGSSSQGSTERKGRTRQ
eukprot:3230886-Prymnesium_polylepis.1